VTDIIVTQVWHDKDIGIQAIRLLVLKIVMN